ncbi:MAG: CoB--CoM heterodisulfide reductase iron-sulfur subunit B family protein [Parasporobacterium sp.]|nr:CoB--CoM heterodisulfide reductase iron-sulfur subunit B family protein [Parasporobacterium sp.]
MKQYAYFPGCSMDSTAVTYKKSTDFLINKLGIELKEIPDWCCCGSTAAHTKNENTALSLAARNLAIAESAFPGLDVVTPCASCYSRLAYASFAGKNDELKRQQIEKFIDRPFKAEADILSFLDMFSDEEIMEEIKNKVVRNLTGLKVACYYGCLYSRPRHITGQTCTEYPMNMDKLMALTGAEAVDWDFKCECCGASHQVDAPKQSRPLIDRIFRNAQANGAQAIITACPLCNMNLDMREEEINKTYSRKYNIPVYQFTEILAIALGAKADESGIHNHFYPAFKLINDVLSGKAGK